MSRKFLIKPKTIFFVCISDEREVFSKVFNAFTCVYFESIDECFRLFEKIMDFPDLLFIDPSKSIARSIDLMKFVSMLGIPVVVLWDAEDIANEETFLLAGGINILYKPVTERILFEKLDAILQKSFIQNNLIERIGQNAVADDIRYFDKSAEGDVFFQALTSLSAVLDAKDSYTQGHSLRVALYSCLLAKKLGYSDKDVSVVHYCALVHDIGKIGVPDTILKKSGKLSKTERGLINRHTVIGYDVLKSITKMPELALVARSHHERWDGSGYPDGLVGMKTPAFARIVCIADSFDAMTSNRAYRASMTFSMARDEIMRCAGTEFDPVFAKAAVSVIDEYLEKEELPSMFPT